MYALRTKTGLEYRTNTGLETQVKAVSQSLPAMLVGHQNLGI